MILVLFFVWEVARMWTHWNYSFDMHFNYLGLISCFSPSWIPLRAHLRVAAVSEGLKVDSICFLSKRQETFFVYQNCRQHFFFLATAWTVTESSIYTLTYSEPRHFSLLIWVVSPFYHPTPSMHSGFNQKLDYIKTDCLTLSNIISTQSGSVSSLP